MLGRLQQGVGRKLSQTQQATMLSSTQVWTLEHCQLCIVLANLDVIWLPKPYMFMSGQSCGHAQEIKTQQVLWFDEMKI